MRNRILSSVFLLLTAVPAACGSGATVNTPPGFAILDDHTEYAYRATTADGTVIAVRTEENNPVGNLDFWAGVVNRQLRRTGHVPSGAARPVHTRNGLVGREMKYAHEENGRKYRFIVRVYVSGSKVWIVEAGGDLEHFDDATALLVQAAIDSISLRK